MHFFCESVPSFPLKIPSLRPCPLFEFPVPSLHKILVWVFSSVNAGGRALHFFWSYPVSKREKMKRGGRERGTPPRTDEDDDV